MSSLNFGEVIPQLTNEWQHPTQTLSVLTLVGPDVIRCALAQLAGTPFTPIAFSFGWVAYSFSNLTNGGKLLPPPDLSSLVVNAENGYARDNHSWVIGRILRDFHYWMPVEVSQHVERIVNIAREKDKEKGKPATRNKAGLCISVFSCSRPAGKPVYDFAYYSGYLVALLQFAISVVPFATSGDWVPFLLTVSGTILAFAAGALPQWRTEKWGTPSGKKQVVLTQGNGAQHAIVIVGSEDGMDFEVLAALEPATSRITRAGNLTLAVLWILHLITLVEMDRDAWYFMAIGGIGMLHNVLVASVPRRPAALGLHLDYVECFADPKVMHALQAVEKSYPGVGANILPIFFPGKLRPDEELFWRDQANNRSNGTTAKISEHHLLTTETYTDSMSKP